MRLLILLGTVCAALLANSVIARAQAAAVATLAQPAANATGGADSAVSVGTDALPDASSLPDPPAPQLTTPTMTETYKPITAGGRLQWIATATLDYPSLIGGVFSAAIGTGLDHPHEDGPHWGGFAERYGIRLTGVATSNVMEAGIGAIWGEDPRYFREEHASFGGHVKNVVKQTFYARRRNGDFQFAYARVMAITGSNFLSNTWRADSEADSAHAMLRAAEGFGDKALWNTWAEFWPLIHSHFHH
jgi:hypothetical protein